MGLKRQMAHLGEKGCCGGNGGGYDGCWKFGMVAVHIQ